MDVMAEGGVLAQNQQDDLAQQHSTKMSGAARNVGIDHPTNKQQQDLELGRTMAGHGTGSLGHKVPPLLDSHV